MFVSAQRRKKGENEPLHGKKLSWGRHQQEGFGPQEAHDARIQPRRSPDARIESRKPQEARIQGLGGGKEKPFLNPKRVEGQGGQNQLSERSAEKGFF